MKAEEQAAYTPAYRPAGLSCPVCRGGMQAKLARGRKSGKSFVTILCIQDPRHFRAFITYQPYVAQVLSQLERE